MSFPEKHFVISEETLRRCKIIMPDEKARKRFVPISVELFSYFYVAKKIEFSIWFRFGRKYIEFIKKDELSKELLDQLWKAMGHESDDLETCVLVSERPRFEEMIEEVRQQKITHLLERMPDLDRKTIDVFQQVSTASQAIVRGGIDVDVAQKVAASAKYIVGNLLDSEALITTLGKMIVCDPTLYDHSATVAMLASAIASKHLKKPLTGKDLELVAQGGLYHDVGKTCVPNAILNKPGKYTPEEFDVMKTHTTEGHRVLLDCIEHGAPIERTVARVAFEHHEKFCGGGYPCNRRGRFETDEENGIHLFSRIVTIADVYSALLMKRVYKEAFAPQDAILIMTKMAQDFDPDIFRSFLGGIVESINAIERRSPNHGRILVIGEDGHLSELKSTIVV